MNYFCATQQSINWDLFETYFVQHVLLQTFFYIPISYKCDFLKKDHFYRLICTTPHVEHHLTVILICHGVGSFLQFPCGWWAQIEASWKNGSFLQGPLKIVTNVPLMLDCFHWTKLSDSLLTYQQQRGKQWWRGDGTVFTPMLPKLSWAGGLQKWMWWNLSLELWQWFLKIVFQLKPRQASYSHLSCFMGSFTVEVLLDFGFPDCKEHKIHA